MKRILILGAGIMQGPSIREARRLGWEVHIADGNPNAPLRNEAQHFTCIDLKDIDSLIAYGRALKGGLDGVFTAGTDFSFSVAKVAEALGLPGMPVAAAERASNKALMREAFAREGLPSPAYIAAKNLEDLNSIDLEYPLVVKPVDNMGSRACRRVEKKEELESAFLASQAESRSHTVIVEEYIDGPEYSIDSLVFDGDIYICGVADRHIYYPPYFIEMGHTLPAQLETESLDNLISVFKAGVRALGIDLGAAKGDIKWGKNGPMIGEIAGRLSGGYMSGWTYPYASGVNLSRAALLLAVGERPNPEDLQESLKLHSAERAYISMPMRVARIEGQKEAEAMPTVRHLFERAKVGDILSFPKDNVSKAGNTIATASTRKEAIEAAERAAANLLLYPAPDHLPSEEFLQGPLSGEIFPPSAFPLSEEAEQELLGKEEAFFLLPGQARPNLIPIPSVLRPLFSSDCNLRDWQGRSPEEALNLLRQSTGLLLKLNPNIEASCKDFYGFWRSFCRGSWQGGYYWLLSSGFLDSKRL